MIFESIFNKIENYVRLNEKIFEFGVRTGKNTLLILLIITETLKKYPDFQIWRENWLEILIFSVEDNRGFQIVQLPLELTLSEKFSCYCKLHNSPQKLCEFQKDNSSITRDDLARGLNDCFVSTSEFGPFALPMVLEKLETALKVAQLDSLKLLVSNG